MTADQFIEVVYRSNLIPAVRRQAKEGCDISNSRIANLVVEVVLNLLLNFRHRVQGTILVRADGSFDLLLQGVDCGRSLT